MDTQFKCQFCGKSFTRKSWYDRHNCEKRKRFLSKNNITTVRGHKLFVHWMRRNKYLKRGKSKTTEQFLNSRYYKLFMSLSEFTINQKAMIFSAFAYLDWLIDLQVSSDQWCRDETAQRFIDSIKHTLSPEQHAKASRRFIKNWCYHNSVDECKFFSTVSPAQALIMVQNNELSPWVLFGYEPALLELTDRFEDELLYRLDEFVNINYWSDMIESNSLAVKQINKVFDDETV